MCETGESSMFKSFFYQFDPVLTPAQMRAPKSNVAAAVADKPVDMSALHQMQKEETPIDDGSGELTIWRIEDFKKVRAKMMTRYVVSFTGHFFPFDVFVAGSYHA